MGRLGELCSGHEWFGGARNGTAWQAWKGAAMCGESGLGTAGKDKRGASWIGLTWRGR
jgi:hypothetical protein